VKSSKRATQQKMTGGKYKENNRNSNKGSLEILCVWHQDSDIVVVDLVLFVIKIQTGFRSLSQFSAFNRIRIYEISTFEIV
jgi:hypothetical protein